MILANLVVGENVVPEFLQEDCTPEKLAQALHEVLGDSPPRSRRTRRSRSQRRHVDRQSDAKRPGRRHRAGDDVAGANRELAGALPA